MSDTSSLSELARFVGRSRLNADTAPQRRRTVEAIAARLAPHPHGVGELLGIVLTLSARTRRVMMPRVAIDVDVFRPDGARAVRLLLPAD